MKVEITHDIACAWSALGYARFRRAAAEHRARGGDLEVAFRPYKSADCRAGAPVSGAPRLASAGQAERLVRAAAADGLDIRFDRIVPAATCGAHRLIAAAAEQGTAEDMAARLYRAYFTDGLDIGDAGVLRGLASAAGVPWTGGEADERLGAGAARPGRAAGPRVPVFRFPDGTVLVGAVSLTMLQGELRRAVSVTA
ncbi:DsbA family oxidoreductase [Actinomadura fibrosa]|uniref:DsbA family protein n=1 Tax=Actinomadura fibrosa TaxID=111802 RepID=A0ABW2XPJ7_9ACTN|nr:DsbA family protein [Actinomadura fibrosa]